MQLTDTVDAIVRVKGSQVWSIAPTATVYEAIELMAEKGVGALLVIAGGTLAGIMSERDYARKVVLKGKSSRDTRVSEIMSSPVVFVSPEDTVDHCMKTMTERRIRHLPVLKDEKVVAVISSGDLMKWIISVQKDTIHHLEDYITDKYPR